MTKMTDHTPFRFSIPHWSSWDQAGITKDGRLDRPAAALQYRVPYKVELRDGKLEYWWQDPDVLGWTGRPPWPRQAGEQLSSFVRLGAARDTRIRAFASRYGVLLLCRHWRPWTHSLGSVDPCRPLGADADENLGWEPIWAWRFYARQAVALLNVCARLRDGRSAPDDDWSVIYDRNGPIMAPYRCLEQGPETGEARVSGPINQQTGEEDFSYEPLYDEFGLEPPISRCPPDVQRWCASSVIELWLYPTWPHIHFDWEEEQPTLGLSTPRLWDILALQIVLAASRTDGIAICSACARPYLPSQQPKANRRSYCPTCREEGKPQRDAARDYRRRRRERDTL